MSYEKESFALSSDINAYKVLQATDWLTSNSNLYKSRMSYSIQFATL